MPGFQLARPPRTDDELYWTVRGLFGVRIPRVAVCPDHVAPFTVFADIYFGRNSLAGGAPCSHFTVHASRGLAGKSYILSTLGLTFAFLRGADITLLGGSMAQSMNVHEYMRNLLNSPGIDEDFVLDRTATRIKLANGGRIRPIPASQRTVRGPHPSILEMDEVDEMDLSIYDAALGQPMPQRNYLGEELPTRTVVSSTWQNADGCFSEILRRAEVNRTPVYRWCYRESANPVDGWLTDEAIEEKRKSISAEMFRIEYDLGEPSIGNRAFDTEAVNRTFSLPFEPIHKKESKDFEEYRFAKRVRGGRYVIGADWGREQDYTVIAVGRVDVTPHQLVYYLRVNRRPYPVMVGYFNQTIKDYRGAAAHDNTGLGTVVDDYTDASAYPFTMTGEKRAALLSGWVSAVENDRWRIPAIPTMFHEYKYARTGDLYSTRSDYHLPDTVAAGALMHFMAERVVPAVAPTVVRRDSTPSKTEALFTVREQPEDTFHDPQVRQDGFSLVV